MSTITWGFDFDDVLCLTPRLPAAARLLKLLMVQAPPLHNRGVMRFAPEQRLLRFAQEIQADGARIVIVSGRRTWVSQSTERWLGEIGLKFDAVVHKPPFDRLSTPRYKTEAVRRLGCQAFVDDDPKNVDAINRGGTCTAFLWEGARADETIEALRGLHRRLKETFGTPDRV